MGRDYTRLTYKEFGTDLLSTHDLDPLYGALARCVMPEWMLKRWLLAYWCYYSAGAASQIAESNDFYKSMLGGLRKYPRGHERRHFRGDIAVKAINALQDFGEPEEIVDYMTTQPDFHSMSKHVQSFPYFGPWISWKIADMTERVLQYPLSFDGVSLFMYSEPVKGAALWLYGDVNHKMYIEDVDRAVHKSMRIWDSYFAPPYLDRPLNVQEIETILCKYKAHINGHYPLGNDSFEIAEGLRGYGDLSQQLFQCLDKSTSYAIGDY